MQTAASSMFTAGRPNFGTVIKGLKEVFVFVYIVFTFLDDTIYVSLTVLGIPGFVGPSLSIIVYVYHKI